MFTAKILIKIREYEMQKDGCFINFIKKFSAKN